MARRLAASGVDLTTGVGGTGVVGSQVNGPGSVALLRADLDGLSVREETGLDYASTATATDAHGAQVPVSHACGHDLHTACLLGAVEALAADRGSWSGTLLLVFQPADELVRCAGDGGRRAVRAVPGAGGGARSARRTVPPNHSPGYAPALDPTLRIGVTAV